MENSKLEAQSLNDNILLSVVNLVYLYAESVATMKLYDKHSCLTDAIKFSNSLKAINTMLNNKTRILGCVFEFIRNVQLGNTL